MARRKDENQTAFFSLQELLKRDAERNGLSVVSATEKKDEKAVRAGKRGGKIRARNVSARRRHEIAKKAAQKRWAKSDT